MNYTISSGNEIITKKGKVYKFDDMGCMIRFMKAGGVDEKSIMRTIVLNYENPNEFIDAEKAVLLSSELTKSPMGFNLAAFSNPDAAAKLAGTTGKIISWKELYNQVE